eukprot:6479488-Amphidinium_carterae.1
MPWEGDGWWNMARGRLSFPPLAPLPPVESVRSVAFSFGLGGTPQTKSPCRPDVNAFCWVHLVAAPVTEYVEKAVPQPELQVVERQVPAWHTAEEVVCGAPSCCEGSNHTEVDAHSK